MSDQKETTTSPQQEGEGSGKSSAAPKPATKAKGAQRKPAAPKPVNMGNSKPAASARSLPKSVTNNMKNPFDIGGVTLAHGKSMTLTAHHHNNPDLMARIERALHLGLLSRGAD